MVDKISSKAAVGIESQAATSKRAAQDDDSDGNFLQELSQAGSKDQEAAVSAHPTKSQLSAKGRKLALDGNADLRGQKASSDSESFGLAGEKPEKEKMKAELAVAVDPGMAAAKFTPEAMALRSSDKKYGIGPTSSADQSPLTLRPSASANTASVIAGPKPWSKDWVFVGGENENPELKTLLPSKDKLSIEAQAAQMRRTADPKTQGKNVSPKSAEAANLSQNPRVQGGDAGMAMVLENLRKELAQIDGNQENLGTEGAKASELRGLAGPAGTAGLQHHLQALNGRLEEATVPGAAPKLNPASAGASGMHSSLSGDEFLKTLSGIRAGTGGSGQSQLSGENPGGGQRGFSSAPGSEFRVIDGGLKNKKTQFGDHNLTPAGVAPLWTSDRSNALEMPRTDMTGHVVKGAMSQDRLSSESLLGMSSGIRGLAPQGGGEIRVRLKPEHLGELNVRVVAHGNDVGLRIQASDENAKKVIEESLVHLKDSLAEQNLNLARIDVSVAREPGHASGSDARSDSQQPQHGGYQGDLMGQNANQGHQNRSNDWVGDNDLASPIAMRPGRSQAQVSAAQSGASESQRAYRGDGRLDITA